MPPYPERQSEMLNWFEQRVGDWATAPNTIGLTNDTVNTLGTTMEEARAAFDAAEEAKAAYQAAVEVKRAAFDALGDQGLSAIQQIRSFAEGVGGPGVYGAANVPPTKTPAPTPAPAMPTNVTGTLNNDGSTQVTWTGKRSGGVVFTVQRRFEDAQGQLSSFETLGTFGETFFTDNSLPAGTCAATYQIKATRGTKESAWSEAVTVRFTNHESGGDELRIAA